MTRADSKTHSRHRLVLREHCTDNDVVPTDDRITVDSLTIAFSPSENYHTASQRITQNFLKATGCLIADYWRSRMSHSEQKLARMEKFR